MGRNVIPFHEAQASSRCRHQYVDEQALSDQYYESLVQLRDSLKLLAQECGYIAVGDEIVSQLTDASEE